MPAFAGDTISGAAAAFNNWESQQQAGAANAWNQMVQQRNLNATRRTQAGEFAAQMAAGEKARQDAADYSRAMLDLTKKRYQAEADWRTGQLDLQKKQLEYDTTGKLPPNQANTIHINLAQADASQGFPDLPAGDITPDHIKQYYGVDDDTLANSLASMGNAARTKIGADFEAAKHLADYGNKFPQVKRAQADITSASTVNRAPFGAWLNPLRWFGRSNRPDTSWAAGQQQRLNQIIPPQRANGLQAALATAVQQGQIALDPTTGTYTTAIQPPRFLTGDRTSMSGAMKPATTMTATTPPPNKAETDAATSTIYRDKTGTEWRYRGTAGDPAQDQDPNNWEQVTDNEQ